MTDRVEILDTTLRDGAQGEGISFSISDKTAVVRALDELGVSWIEAGNPGSNPKDIEFFHVLREMRFEHAKICAFGPTRKKGNNVRDDPQALSLLEADTEGVVIFGKTWDLHVAEVLRVSLEENLEMIAETIAFMKLYGRQVFFDAEHFFDGWLANPEYALKTLFAAVEAGADRVILCDTNGGSTPDAVMQGVAQARAKLEERFPGRLAEQPFLGIHAHNDAGFAAANTALAVINGCRHVQGTLAGFGERCGNAALAVAIPSIELKLGLPCLPPGKLERISEITRMIAEIANLSIPDTMPYVGAHAFSHKAGMHTDGILKTQRSFEHIDPAMVGNSRRFLMSEMGGRTAIAERARKLEPSLTRDHPAIAAIAERLKGLEADGWQFEGADASFELLVRRELNRYTPLFTIEAYRVISEHPPVIAMDHAWIKVLVDGTCEVASAEGEGPVDALNKALRKALQNFYPELKAVRLTDFKVRVIDGSAATAAKVRVLIESTDGLRSWTTVGVSADIIEASRIALVESIEYKLIGDLERRYKVFSPDPAAQESRGGEP